MRMNARAGILVAGAFALVMGGSAVPAKAQELSEKAVASFMDYAWSLTPQQFSKPDGSVVQIDKKKKEEVLIPVDVAREVIMAGRMSAHAQVCKLGDEQIENHRALMRREEARKKWTPQQMVYISQLHLTTVMLLTGKIKLVEKEGDKEVVVEEGKAPPAQTCTPEQATKVATMIKDYVDKSPKAAAAAAPSAAPATAAAAAAPTATGSTDKAVAPAPAKAAAPAATPPAATPAPAVKKP
jgi:hypothetical protein